MIFDLILLVYALGAVFFFVALLRDKYVELNKVILLVYIVASLVWPISGLIYLLDSRN